VQKYISGGIFSITKRYLVLLRYISDRYAQFQETMEDSEPLERLFLFPAALHQGSRIYPDIQAAGALEIDNEYL
jgi:hypothetical protein